jgi:hypothetical protein
LCDNGELIEMKSAEYCRNLIFGLFIREPFNGESISFTIMVRVLRRRHHFPEKTLQGGTETGVDDGGFATGEAPDFPDVEGLSATPSATQAGSNARLSTAIALRPREPVSYRFFLGALAVWLRIVAPTDG